jgi:hypothetical protein
MRALYRKHWPKGSECWERFLLANHSWFDERLWSGVDSVWVRAAPPNVVKTKPDGNGRAQARQTAAEPTPSDECH